MRITAITLLLVLMAPTVLACVQQDPESQLPPCCRRDGKHHCAMMARFMTRMQAGSPAFGAGTEPCPYRHLVFTPTSRHFAGLPPSQAFYASVVSHPVIRVQVVLFARISDLRADSKRGPPQAHS